LDIGVSMMMGIARWAGSYIPEKFNLSARAIALRFNDIDP
jgi:hypothetical protein